MGLGRFGRAIAETLCQDGAEVLGVDRRMDVVEDLRDTLTHTVQMDAMDRDALAALGIPDFDVAFVTMGSDIRASGTIVMSLKELGAKRVIAKAQDEFHGRMLEKLGADQVLFPERDMGRRVAHNLVSGDIIDFLELSSEYSMAEIRPKPEWVGKTLMEPGHAQQAGHQRGGHPHRRKPERHAPAGHRAQGGGRAAGGGEGRDAGEAESTLTGRCRPAGGRCFRAKQTVGCLLIDDPTSGENRLSGLSALDGIAPGPLTGRRGRRPLPALQTPLQRVRREYGAAACWPVGTGCVAALALAEQLPVERLALIEARRREPAPRHRPNGALCPRNLSLCVSDALIVEAATRGAGADRAGACQASGRLCLRDRANCIQFVKMTLKTAIFAFLRTGELPKSLAENPEMCIIYG